MNPKDLEERVEKVLGKLKEAQKNGNEIDLEDINESSELIRYMEEISARDYSKKYTSKIREYKARLGIALYRAQIEKARNMLNCNGNNGLYEKIINEHEEKIRVLEEEIRPIALGPYIFLGNQRH